MSVYLIIFPFLWRFFFLVAPWLFRNGKKWNTYKKNTHAFIQMDLSRCLMWMCIDEDVRRRKDYLITWRIRASHVHVRAASWWRFTMQLNLIWYRWDSILFSLVDFLRALVFFWRCVNCTLFTPPISCAVCKAEELWNDRRIHDEKNVHIEIQIEHKMLSHSPVSIKHISKCSAKIDLLEHHRHRRRIQSTFMLI